MVKKILIVGKDSYIGKSFISYCQKQSVNFMIEEVSSRNEKWKEVHFGQYDSILHLAGIAHNSSDPKLEDLYYAVNRDLTIEVARKAKEDGAKQFVFMSSIIVFGSQNELITEKTQPHPDNFYGDSKLQAEKRIASLQDDKFKVAIIRPPMVYGPGSKGNFPRLVKVAKTLPFFPAYKNQRSMIFIDNLNHFIYQVISRNLSGCFHPQNERYICVAELVEEIAILSEHRIRMSKKFNSSISFCIKKNVFMRKVFGDLMYKKNLSTYDFDYNVISFKESIRKSIGDELSG